MSHPKIRCDKAPNFWCYAVPGATNAVHRLEAPFPVGKVHFRSEQSIPVRKAPFPVVKPISCQKSPFPVRKVHFRLESSSSGRKRSTSDRKGPFPIVNLHFRSERSSSDQKALFPDLRSENLISGPKMTFLVRNLHFQLKSFNYCRRGLFPVGKLRFRSERPIFGRKMPVQVEKFRCRSDNVISSLKYDFRKKNSISSDKTNK